MKNNERNPEIEEHPPTIDVLAYGTIGDDTHPYNYDQFSAEMHDTSVLNAEVAITTTTATEDCDFELCCGTTKTDEIPNIHIANAFGLDADRHGGTHACMPEIAKNETWRPFFVVRGISDVRATLRLAKAEMESLRESHRSKHQKQQSAIATTQIDPSLSTTQKQSGRGHHHHRKSHQQQQPSQDHVQEQPQPQPKKIDGGTETIKKEHTNGNQETAAGRSRHTRKVLMEIEAIIDNQEKRLGELSDSLHECIETYVRSAMITSRRSELRGNGPLLSTQPTDSRYMFEVEQHPEVVHAQQQSTIKRKTETNLGATDAHVLSPDAILSTQPRFLSETTTTTTTTTVTS